MSDIKEFNSIEDIENSKSKWNLTSDLKLLRLLENTSNECMDRMQKNLCGFEDLSYKTNTASNKVNNLINDILILTNTKFIENRVYDEDIKDITSKKDNVFKNVNNSTIDDERKLINRLENSVNKAMHKLFTEYDISQVDLNDKNQYNLLHTLYSKKNRFCQKKLPYLIGSDEFLKDTFVGLKDETDYPVIEHQQPQHTETENVNQKDIVFNNFDINHELVDEPLQIQPKHKDDSPQMDDIDHRRVENQVPEPKFSIVIDNNNSDMFDSRKNKMPVYSDSSEDEDIFTRPTIVRPNEESSKPFNNFDEDSTLIKTTFLDEKDDLFEEAIPSSSNEPTKNSTVTDNKVDFSSTTNASNFSQKYLDNDDDNDEFDDIFNTRTSQNQKQILKTDSNVFFSSDDDDDFFTQISKSSKKKENPVKATDLFDDDKDDDKPKNEVIFKENISKSNEPKIQNIHSKKELSNVINELNSVLQLKMPSTEKENKTALPEKPDNNFVENPLNISDDEKPTQTEETSKMDDNLNSMLKHKTRLNSQRQRKRPSKYKKPQQSIQPEPEDHKEDDDLFDSSIVTNVKISPQKDVHIQNKLNEDLKSEPKIIPILSPSNTETTQESNQEKKLEIETRKIENKSKSIFDSSEDSDDDIFSKTNLTSYKKTLPQQKVIKNPASLFADSDEESETEVKLSSNFKSEIIPTASKQMSSQLDTNKDDNKTKKAVKSIFDDDSDDDLFKF